MSIPAVEEKKEPTLMEEINTKEKELMENINAHIELKRAGYKLIKKMLCITDSEKKVEANKQYAENKKARADLKKKKLKIFDILLPKQHAWYKNVITEQQKLLKEKDEEMAELKKKLPVIEASTVSKEEILDFTNKGIKTH
jgi:hypothetical protein